MADKKITQLTQHTSVINSDLLAVVDVTATETKKLAIGTLRDFTNQGLLSSSTQIATEISGAFTATSASINTTINSLSSSISTDITNIQSSYILSSSISGSPSYVAYYDSDGNLSNSSIKFNNSGSLNNVDYISFYKEYEHVHNEGNIQWKDDLKTLTIDTDVLGFDIEVGQKMVQRVKNVTGAPLSKGDVVYINGGDSAWPTVTTASWEGDPTSAYTLGIMGNDTLNNQYGYAVLEGMVRNVDTSGYTAGQVFYLAATGSWTGSAPQSPLHEVRLGHVVRVHQESGSVFTRIQNGYEFSELHDVENYNADTLSDGYHIEWDASTKIWRPARPDFEQGKTRLFVAAARSNTSTFLFNSQTRTSDTSASPTSDSAFMLISGDLDIITIHLRSSTSVSATVDILKNVDGTAFSTATSIVTPQTISLTADTVSTFTFTGLTLNQFDSIHVKCTPGGAGDFYGIIEIT